MNGPGCSWICSSWAWMRGARRSGRFLTQPRAAIGHWALIIVSWRLISNKACPCRKLWTVFLSEMTDASNPMPKNVRQNVANIGLFVMNHTVTVMTDPRPIHLDSLISINREIAAGLLGRAA